MSEASGSRKVWFGAVVISPFLFPRMFRPFVSLPSSSFASLKTAFGCYTFRTSQLGVYRSQSHVSLRSTAPPSLLRVPFPSVTHSVRYSGHFTVYRSSVVPLLLSPSFLLPSSSQARTMLVVISVVRIRCTPSSLLGRLLSEKKNRLALKNHTPASKVRIRSVSLLFLFYILFFQSIRQRYGQKTTKKRIFKNSGAKEQIFI